MSDEESDESILPYTSIRLYLGPSVDMTAMCYGVRLHIEVRDKDLSDDLQDGPSQLQLQFRHFLEAMNDEAEAMQSLEDWLIRPCIPHIQHIVSPTHRTVKYSLYGFYHPTTIVFILSNEGGQLKAISIPGDPSMLSGLTPRISIFEPAVSAAIQQGVPCIAASKMMIIRDEELSDWEYYDVPALLRALS